MLKALYNKGVLRWKMTPGDRVRKQDRFLTNVFLPIVGSAFVPAWQMPNTVGTGAPD